MSKLQLINAAFLFFASAAYVFLFGSAALADVTAPKSKTSELQIVSQEAYLTANTQLISDSDVRGLFIAGYERVADIPKISAPEIIIKSDTFVIRDVEFLNSTGAASQSGHQTSNQDRQLNAVPSNDGAAMISWPFLTVSVLVALLLWTTQRREYANNEGSGSIAAQAL